MFFIFSYDLFLSVILLGMFLVMLVMFPTFTLILTGLCIWVLVAAIKGSREEDEDHT